MNKINKNSINFAFKTLALLAFSLLIVPVSASARSNDFVYGVYTSDITGGSTYRETNNPKPVINSISPSSVNKGVGTKTITIFGSGFIPSSVVRINGSDRFTTFIDSSHLFVQTNNYDLSRDGGFYITVFNGFPGGGFSNAVFFTVSKVSAPAVNTNNNVYNSAPVDTYSETNQTYNDTYNSNATLNTDNYSNLASNAIFGSNSFLPSGLIQWVLFAIIILLIVIIVRKIFGAEAKYHAAPLKHS